MADETCVFTDEIPLQALGAKLTVEELSVAIRSAVAVEDYLKAAGRCMRESLCKLQM